MKKNSRDLALKILFCFMVVACVFITKESMSAFVQGVYTKTVEIAPSLCGTSTYKGKDCASNEQLLAMTDSLGQSINGNAAGATNLNIARDQNDDQRRNAGNAQSKHDGYKRSTEKLSEDYDMNSNNKSIVGSTADMTAAANAMRTQRNMAAGAFALAFAKSSFCSNIDNCKAYKACSIAATAGGVNSQLPGIQGSGSGESIMNKCTLSSSNSCNNLGASLVGGVSGAKAIPASFKFVTGGKAPPPHTIQASSVPECNWLAEYARAWMGTPINEMASFSGTTGGDMAKMYDTMAGVMFGSNYQKYMGLADASVGASSVFPDYKQAQQDACKAGKDNGVLGQNDCQDGGIQPSMAGTRMAYAKYDGQGAYAFIRAKGQASTVRTLTAEAEAAGGEAGKALYDNNGFDSANASAMVPYGRMGYTQRAENEYVPPKTLVSGLSLKDIFGPQDTPASLLSMNTH